MPDTKNTLTVIDGETLIDARPEPIKFCIDTLLPQGLCILGGAPKIGKSWLVLDICVRVAKGEDVWGLQTHRGVVLYLCLEDSLNRLSLSTITDGATLCCTGRDIEYREIELRFDKEECVWEMQCDSAGNLRYPEASRNASSRNPCRGLRSSQKRSVSLMVRTKI